MSEDPEGRFISVPASTLLGKYDRLAGVHIYSVVLESISLKFRAIAARQMKSAPATSSSCHPFVRRCDVTVAEAVQLQIHLVHAQKNVAKDAS
jgi:hypothetical protein